MISSRMSSGEIERIVRREIPVGSTILEAQEFLEAAGFACQFLRGEASYYGAIHELNPLGDGLLRGTLTNPDSHWPSMWISVVDIHIVRGLATDCRAVAFTTR